MLFPPFPTPHSSFFHTTMTESAQKPPANGCDTSSCRTEEQRQKISEVRSLISPVPDKLAAAHFSDESISRFLISQKWNVHKASKMLNESFKWRLQYKPEEIRWEDVAYEAESGKIYKLNFEDKQGRSVLIMRPRFQNSKSTIESQMRYLVYCLEKALMNHEEMIWLVDFHGFKTSNISLQVARRTTYIMQNYYPQRLANIILYDAPNIFEPFWKLVKYFADSEMTRKVKFVYSSDPDTKTIMERWFEMEKLDIAFGGKYDKGFSLNDYAKRMKEEDMKMV